MNIFMKLVITCVFICVSPLEIKLAYLLVSQSSTEITIVKCRGFVCVQRFHVRGARGCVFYWY